MPISQLSITVSHLPSSTSFYLSALQPLGYRYIGQHDKGIALGVDEADFFIYQKTSNIGHSPVHIAFEAGSQGLVDRFFTAAVKAGGRIISSPSHVEEAGGSTAYSCSVADLDGNSTEAYCSYHQTDAITRTSQHQHQHHDQYYHQHQQPCAHECCCSSAVLASLPTGHCCDLHCTPRNRDENDDLLPFPLLEQRDQQHRFADAKSINRLPIKAANKSQAEPVNFRDSCDRSQALLLQQQQLQQQQQQAINKNDSIACSKTSTGETDTVSTSGFFSEYKTLIGTVLGVAAGAAITYALCKPEEEIPELVEHYPQEHQRRTVIEYEEGIVSDTESLPSRHLTGIVKESRYTESDHKPSPSVKSRQTPEKTEASSKGKKRKSSKTKRSSSKSRSRTQRHGRPTLLIEAPPPVQEHSATDDKMSTYPRTTVRAIEPATSLTYRPKASSHVVPAPRSIKSPRSTMYSVDNRLAIVEPARSNASLSSRRSRSSSGGEILRLPTQSDFPLPRSARDIPLPPSKPGSNITITVTSAPQTVFASRSSRHSGAPHSYTKYTTETYVFSPRDQGPSEYPLPPSSRGTRLSSHSSRSPRTEDISLPPSVATYRTPRPRRLEKFAETRIRYITNAPPPPRSAMSTGFARSPVGQYRLERERAMTDVDDDAESLAPSDSISCVSSKQYRKRSSRSHR